MWNIYYHLYLNAAEVDVVLKQVTTLLDISKSIDNWKASVYGKTIKFCDADTLTDARRVWIAIKNAAENSKTDTHRKAAQANLQLSKDIQRKRLGKDGTMVTGLRSAAPLSLQSRQEIPRAYRQYWKDGTVTPKDAKTTFPNPTFSGLLNDRELLHYGTDPLLGFHLATAFAPLADTSPLKPQGVIKDFSTAAAAKTQFKEWTAALKAVIGIKFTLRFAVCDALTFSHSLQNAGSSSNCANLYRKLWDTRPLILDEQSYGTNGTSPTLFDMIDTSNLDDHIGTLNILIAAGPLLKSKPWASLFTEKLLKAQDTQKKAFNALLAGHAPTVSLLIGFSPVQYWTNAKCESHVDEIFLGLGHTDSPNQTQLHSRLAWKRDDQLSGQPGGRGKLRIDAKSLAKILFQLYLNMFEREDASRALASINDVKAVYPHFHRASFAALLKMTMNRVNTDWPAMCDALMQLVSDDKKLLLGSNQRQELAIQLHLIGINTEQWVLNQIRHVPELGDFNAWTSLPPVVAVTLVVPREKFTRLFEGSENRKVASPSLVGSLRATLVATNQWHNMFGAVHIAFGNVKATGSRNDDKFAVSIQADSKGWSGSSPLIASWYVPTAALQVEPKSALVGVCIPPTGHNSALYAPILGISMAVFETRMDNASAVYVTKFMPGQTGYPTVCGEVQTSADKVNKGKEDKTTELIVELAGAQPRITTITGHLDINSIKGRDLLKEKVPIELRQKNPFIVDIVFGQNDLVCPLKFPVPVTAAGSRTRIARTSGYIEVVAPLAQPGASDTLSDFMFPAALSQSGLPATLNTPHLNLENLPILNLEQKEEMKWLTSHTSLMFSAREKRLREATDETGISDDPRVNFKESLFTMFMLCSGLQGGQTGMFAINHPEKGGIHMLIFVSAMRLDGDTASVVLDAAVIPFTTKLIESGKMEAFLLLIRTLECCTLNVNDSELILWKKILPSLAERCRTWSHGTNCEYKRKDATIPLSLEDGQQLLCSCGNGRLPDNFVGLPEWDTAAPNAVRIAISPTYAVPFVEDVIDPVDLSKFQAAAPEAPEVERCRHCGKTEADVDGTLKRCTRCLKVKYCSVECQRKDWKKHRGECAEKE